MKKKNSQVVERCFLDTIVKHGTLDGTFELPGPEQQSCLWTSPVEHRDCAGSEPASTSIPSATLSA